MALSNKVEKFNTNVSRLDQIINGGPDTVVMTDGGPVKSIAHVMADAEAVLAQLAVLGPELAKPGGGDLVRIATGETVTAAVAAIRQDILGLQDFVATELTTTNVKEGDKLFFTATRVLTTKLAELSLVSGAAVTADDTVLSALGKLQKQLNNMVDTLAKASRRVGDVVVTARKDYVAPEWLPCDGSTYLRTSYPDLAALLPIQYPSSKMLDANSQPSHQVQSVAVTSDGAFMAIAIPSSSTTLRVYKRTQPDRFTSVTVNSQPPSSAYGLAFSPDGQYLAVACGGAPYLVVYKRSLDNYNLLSNPPQPSNQAFAAAFSANGAYLAIALHNLGGRLALYSRSGDSFTKLPDPALPPEGMTSHSVAFSPDGTYLALGTSSGQFVYLYKRNGSAFTMLAALDFPPTNGARGIAFSPDGNHLAVAADSNGVLVYKRNGDAFAKLSGGPVAPSGFSAQSVSYSPNGEFLAAGGLSNTFLLMFRRNGDAYSRVPTPTPTPDVAVYSVAFGDSLTLSVGHYNAPYVTSYRVEYDTNTLFKLPVQSVDGTGLLGYIKT